ncbi:MFS transporter [Brevibacterium daeguense]|uniref:MFS transporter n=1 Tax=Brevibacterium daeguense TaxID=909936 RepID=A0ABP8EKB0_9MICO|nr:MFS transporter [Brevibacterium daeguense]
MASDPAAGAREDDRARTSSSRARLGISLFFFLNGFIAAGLLARLPEVKSHLELTTVAFGLIVAAFPLGSISAAWLPAPLIRRFGAAEVAGAGTVILALIFATAGFASAPWLLALLLLLGGFMDAVVDASQNVHGLAVERLRGKSIFNSLHAAWSVGSVTGGALGLGAGALLIPLSTHLVVSGSLAVLIAGWAWSLTVLSKRAPAYNLVGSMGPGAAPAGERADAAAGGAAAGGAAAGGATADGNSAKPWALLIAIIALGLLGALIEDLGMNWSSVYLNQVAGVPVHTAGAAYVVALGGQLIARLLADATTDRIGRPAVVRAGGVLVVCGMLLAMLVAEPWAVVIAFFLSGFGSATFIPSAYAAAGALPGFRHGTAITLTSWVLRIGMLVSSPLLGYAAGLVGLRYALVITLAAGVGAVFAAGWIGAGRRRRRVRERIA